MLKKNWKYIKVETDVHIVIYRKSTLYCISWWSSVGVNIVGLVQEDVTPLLVHWSYVFLALTHRYGLMVWLLCTKIYFRHPGRNLMITDGNKYQTLWSNYILQYTHYSYIMNHDGGDGISNHLHLDYLLNRLFRCRSKKTSKLCITGLCEGKLSGEFPSQRASNRKNVIIWWSHHIYDGITYPCTKHLHLPHIFTSVWQYTVIVGDHLIWGWWIIFQNGNHQ